MGGGGGRHSPYLSGGGGNGRAGWGMEWGWLAALAMMRCARSEKGRGLEGGMWRKEGRLNLRMDGGRKSARIVFHFRDVFQPFFTFEVERRPIFTFGCKTVEKEGREGEYASFLLLVTPSLHFFRSPTRNATASSGPPTWRIYAASHQWHYWDTR